MTKTRVTIKKTDDKPKPAGALWNHFDANLKKLWRQAHKNTEQVNQGRYR